MNSGYTIGTMVNYYNTSLEREWSKKEILPSVTLIFISYS